MIIKTSEASGVVLDWLVDEIEYTIRQANKESIKSWVLDAHRDGTGKPGAYSSDWLWGGPIIEKAGINVMLRYGSLPPNHVHDTWDALIKPEFYSSGRPGTGVKKEVIASGVSPLLAAMRCYVASKLGGEVDVPEELVNFSGSAK